MMGSGVRRPPRPRRTSAAEHNLGVSIGDPLDQSIFDIRYVDAPVVRFHDGNADGDHLDAAGNTDSVLYPTCDANFEVTAVVSV
jgi:hypothetical protein